MTWCLDGLKILLAILLLSFLLSGCRTTPAGSYGVYHTVLKGQTLFRIAKTYNVDIDEVMRYNNISDPAQIADGQEIFIPGADRLLHVEPYKKPEFKQLPPGKKDEKKFIEEPRPLALKKFNIWPVSGNVISPYGMRGKERHDGIDIKAPKGTPIKAVREGKVLFSGGIRGYGNTVIIKHAGFVSTVYAHNDKNLAKEGDFVDEGEVIALTGNTGRATTEHVHFEVRVNNKATDPMPFMP